MEGPRPSRPDELEAVVKLSNTCFRAGSSTGDMGREYPALFWEENSDNLIIMTDDGVPVSLIGVVRQTLLLEGVLIDAASVGSVCTHPDYRMQGLAGKTLEYCSQEYRRRGTDILIVSGGRPLYLRAGCAPAAKAANYTLTLDDVKKMRREGYSLTPLREEDVSEVARLYATESSRYVRPHERFRRFLQGNGCFGSSWFHCVCDASGAMVAYFALGGGGMKEYAGPHSIVAGCLHDAMAKTGQSECKIYLPECEAEMRTIFDGHGFVGEPYDHSGTIKVLSLETIGRKMASRIEELLTRDEAAGLRLADTDDGFLIEAAGQSKEITDYHQIAAIVFSPHCDWPEGLPEAMRSVLEKILPLQLPRTGFSYN